MTDALLEMAEKMEAWVPGKGHSPLHAAGMALAYRDAAKAIRNCANAWQPIETAPKDGTVVLLTDGVAMVAGRWADAVPPSIGASTSYSWNYPEIPARWETPKGALCTDPSTPTHWQPLLAAPTHSAGD